MKQNRTGITSHLYGEIQQQEASRRRVGASFGLHPEDTPRLTAETKPADIDSILICADPAFHNGVKSGRCEFLALVFAKREIVALDVENALQWAIYDTLRPALWRYGYVCGWNQEFYQYAMRKREEQARPSKPVRDERGNANAPFSLSSNPGNRAAVYTHKACHQSTQRGKRHTRADRRRRLV